ncbi:unnamed protein product, partial [Heterosigma akashiwo]
KGFCFNFYLRATGHLKAWAHNKISEFKSESTASTFDGEKRSIYTRSTDKRMKFLVWLEEFAHEVADKLPDENAWVLPYRRFEGVYDEYKQDMYSANRHNEVCCYSYAIHIFNTEKEDIRLTRDKSNFARCKFCESLQRRILKAKTRKEREQLKDIRRRHVQKQRLEREAYYRNILWATKDRTKYLSIIIDGMDQQKTDIPVLSTKVSLTSPLKNRVIGAKVHGIRNYTYIVDSTVKGGANLMVSILLDVLKDLEKDELLPFNDPTFFLQQDNCSENKNKTNFSFLDLLVHFRIFNRVHAGFLMTGHTHEDIDSYFSILAKYLRKDNVICPDPPSLHDAIRSAFSKHDPSEVPVVKVMEQFEVFDFTSFFKPHLDPKIAFHSIPHQFRWTAQLMPHGGSVVLTHYKHWHQDGKW